MEARVPYEDYQEALVQAMAYKGEMERLESERDELRAALAAVKAENERLRGVIRSAARVARYNANVADEGSMERIHADGMVDVLNAALRGEEAADG